MKKILDKMIARAPLEQAELRRAFAQLLDAQTSDQEISAFLQGLAKTGISTEILVAAALALREHALCVEVGNIQAIDTCGTGGDGSHSFNFSTAAALVVAAAGVPVAKHGNRSITSRSGSADFLEALGIPIDLSPEQAAVSLASLNFAFLWAPRYHPALARVQALRRKLGVVTVFNFLGPLLNPAQVHRQVVGVFAVDKMEMMAAALQQLGSEQVWVLHGEGGMDEISLSGPTQVVRLNDGKIDHFSIQLEELGLSPVSAEQMRGGDAEGNARIFLEVLKNPEGSIYSGILLNAASAFCVAGRADNLCAGMALAAESIASGAVLALIERLRATKI